MDADLIVIGSGPGGSSAAIAAAKNGRSVIILERGEQPTESAMLSAQPSVGAQCNRFKYLDNYAPNVVGGGSAINYGVLATPTVEDIDKAVGSVNSASVLRNFASHMKNISSHVSAKTASQPVVKQLSRSIRQTWGLRESNDVALTSSATPARSNSNTVLHVPTFASRGNVRLNYSRLTYDTGLAVEIRSKCDVEMLRDLGEGWEVVLTDKPNLRAPHVIVACGALETPRLLLNSAQRGGLPRGVSRHVGMHLTDHKRFQRTFRMQSGYYSSNENLLPTILSRSVEGTDVHIEMLVYNGLMAVATSLLPCAPCKASSTIELLPRWVQFRDGLSTQTCACNLLGCFSCNALDLINERLVVVLGAEASELGKVWVSADGLRHTQFPELSDMDLQRLQLVSDSFTEIAKASPYLTDAAKSKFIKGLQDTEWHHAGTARMSIDDDGAVNADFCLLDAHQKPYNTVNTSLRIGDNSVMRKLTVFNTQVMASLLGYSAGASLPTAPKSNVMMR